MTEIDKKRLDEHIQDVTGMDIDVTYLSGAHETFNVPGKHRHTLLTMIESLEDSKKPAGVLHD